MEFNRDTIGADIADTVCRHCGQSGAYMTVVVETGSPHFARLDCRDCGRFIDWVSFPDQPKTDRRRSRRKIDDLGERCELCLRHKNTLPKPEKLVHHVLEKAIDEGSDDIQNLRLYCTACHSIVNWIRTYFGHYYPDTE